MKKLFFSIACIGAMMVSLLVGTAVWAAPTSQEQDVTAPVTPPEGTVFAGWFYDDTFETPYREATGTATAKFVDKSILSVKYQLTAGANDGQEFTKLRVITTVDSLKYQSVGFKIEYAGNVLDRSTTSVYRSLTGTDGVAVFNYAPTVFSPDSVYFCAYNVKVMQSRFDTELNVTPYWVTLDGTRVEGEERIIKINAAQVNSGTKYSTLYDAVLSASSGDTVTLLQDQTVSSAITLDKDLTIAGNYTVAHPEADDTILAVSVGNTLMVSDGVTLSGAVSMADGAALSVQGSASIGTANAGVDPAGSITLTANNANGSIVLENTDLVTISGTGEGSAFIPLWGHNKPSDDNASGIGNLSMGEAFMCSCGQCGDHEHMGSCAVPATAWTSWPSSATILPSTTGNYYLTGDVTMSGYHLLAAGTNLTLDLAGCTVLGGNNQFTMYRTHGGTTLTISDSVGTGAMLCRGADATGVGRVVYSWENTGSSTINLNGGTLGAAEGATGTNGVVGVYWGDFNMYGGTILPMAGASDGNANAVSVGSVLSGHQGSLNVYGGTIKGEVILRSSNASMEALNIHNDAQVGISDGSSEAYGIGAAIVSTVACSDVTGNVVIKNTDLVSVSGTGEGSAFTPIWGHNRPSDDNASGTGTLSMGAAFMCVCGQCGEHVHRGCAVPSSPWKAYDGSLTLTLAPYLAGNWYLTRDFTGINRTWKPASGDEIHIDLAGHKLISSSGVSLYQFSDVSAVRLTIADSDSQKRGQMGSSFSGTSSSPGAVVYMHTGFNQKVRVYDTTLIADQVTLTSGLGPASVYDFALVVHRNGLTDTDFYMYGGSIIGNPSSGSPTIATRKDYGDDRYAGIHLVGVTVDGVETTVNAD